VLFRVRTLWTGAKLLKHVKLPSFTHIYLLSLLREICQIYLYAYFMFFRRCSASVAVTVVVALLTSSCGILNGSAHPATTSSPTAEGGTAAHTPRATAGPTVWSKSKVTGFPATDFPNVIDSLYARGVWYVATQNVMDGGSAEVHILSSSDGKNWTDITPPAYWAANAGQPGAPQNLLATDGNKVYLLGADDVGLDVWTEGTDGWDPIVGMNDYESYQGDFLPLGIASSKGCVYTAVIDYPQGMVINGIPSIGLSADAERVDVWPLCGGTFGKPATLSFNATDLVEWDDLQLSADSQGAVLFARGDEYRISGQQLQRVRGIPSQPALTVTDGSTVVAVPGAGANMGGDSEVWRSTGVSVVSSRLPVGQLPDAGVTPPGEQAVASGCSDGSGFVLAGFTRPNESKAVGAIWTSPDGRRWAKMPVTLNGLNRFREILGVGCSPDGILLIGFYINDNARIPVLYSWKGRVAL